MKGQSHKKNKPVLHINFLGKLGKTRDDGSIWWSMSEMNTEFDSILSTTSIKGNTQTYTKTIHEDLGLSGFSDYKKKETKKKGFNSQIQLKHPKHQKSLSSKHP